MSFDSFADFVAMGGYGLYVWWAYGVALVVVGFTLVWPLVRRRRFLREQRRRIARNRSAGMATETRSNASQA